MTLPVGSITGFLRLIGAAEFDAGIVGAQKSMNLAAGTASKLAGALDKSDAAFARSAASARTAAGSAARFRAEQLSATAATERYNAALNSGTASAARLASAEASMIRANERVAASMRASGAASESMAAKSVASMTKVSKALRLPVLAATAGAVYEAAKFQKSMTLIQTAGGETAAKAAAISKGMMQVAQDTGTSLEKLSSGIYTVAKAGAQKWSAADQLEVLRAAAQGAKAENVDLGTSVDALTSVMLGYNMSAQDAVKAENQIIRASGLSKTSMQEFAGSLSNVVPLASSLHISFAQIGGAIATMTQHGETAQRATDNLANLITNLAGQNNVASKAMQQLGLNTVQLQKHLSKNGLTGTLQMVEDSISKSSKAGMVVVSAFKQAQNATHDLQIELGHMDGQLQANSKAFADGSMSYKDYRAYVRSLGGEQYALGKNFMTTVDAAKGFNSQLTSGNAPVRTTASELQKLLGGVTGMRTALMLGGTSAKQFADNVQQVQKASLEAGADVLGWNKTQDTLAVKTDKAKASLQVLAVEVGDSLIPALSKLAVEGEHAIHWVDGLDHTQKEVLGWGIGVAAAMAPVLGIGSRLATVGRGISTFVTGSVSQLARLNTSVALNAAAISRGMSRMAGVLAGAGVGLALGELTQNSSTSTKALGALGAAATGAAIGFGAGGPLGAALGGAAGLLADAATAFHLFGGSVKKQIQPTREFTQAILDDNDALGKNTRSLVENSLESKGAYDAALKLGISQKTLTDAMMGVPGALAKVQAAQLRVTALTGYGTTAASHLTKTQQAQIDANAKLSNAIGDVTDTLNVNKHAADNLAAADPKLKKATDSVAASTKNASSSGNAYLDVLAKLSRKHTIEVGIKDQASARLRALQAIINGLHGKSLAVNVAVATSGGMGGHHADGGTVIGAGTATSDSVPIMASNGEEVINAKQASKHRALLKAINAGVDGFAAGGTVGATVAAQVAASLRPQPTTVAGLSNVLAQHLAGAANRETLTESMLANYKVMYEASRAADKHAKAMQNLANKAKDAAAKIGTSTAAGKAEKKSAEAAAAAADKQAKAAQKVADTADKLASKGKAAYQKLAEASKAATQQAEQDAQALVAQVQSEFDTLQQNIKTFESTIQSGLTGGSDLATIWGNLTSNVDAAKQALDAAQSALVQATPNTASLAAAQSAQAQATAAQAAAHAQLTQALAGGDAAQILAAQQAQTVAAGNLADAQAAVQAATPSADQLAAQAQAQQQLTAAQTAYNQAVQAASGSGVAGVLAQFQASEAQFAGDLNKLKSMGASQDLISQLVGLGDSAGDALAQGLIQDPKALTAITQSMGQIQSIADKESDTLASGFLGAGVKSMQQLLAGVEKQFPETVAALAPLAAELAAMFQITLPDGTTVGGTAGGSGGSSSTAAGSKGATAAQTAAYYLVHDTANGKWYDVNPSKKSVHELTAAQLKADLAAGATVNTRKSGIPHFAAGVTDFPGGLAMVHRDELLVNLPKGTDVVPANRAKAAFGGTDITPLVQRLDRIEARLADAPVLTGQAVGAATVGVIDRYGQAHAKQADRLRRQH